MKQNKLTVQDWIQVDTIFKNGIIKLKNNKYIKLIKILPINFNLKSNLEKESILNSYKIFLKTCNFNIQILIQSNRENLKNHISLINKNIQKKENNYLKNISDNYINYLNNLNLLNKASTKDFYLIINYENKTREKIELNDLIENNLKEKYFKIKDCLLRCGNEVSEINNSNEIINIYNSFLNTRKINKKNQINNFFR